VKNRQKNKRMKKKLLTITLAGLLGMHWSVAAEKSSTTIQKEIDQLSSSIESGKEASKTLSDEIYTLDQKLNKLSQTQHRTEQKINQLEKKLNKSQQRKIELQKMLNSEQEALAQQLQALYLAGEQSHLRLLFRQDEPADISRTMKYMEYLNTARIKRITKTQDTLNELKMVEHNIQLDKQAMQKLVDDAEVQKKQTEQLLSQRSSSRKKLQKSIASKEKQLEALLTQEANLQTMVESIPQQTETLQEQTSQASEPPSTQAEKSGIAVNTHSVPNEPISRLKGKLSWPVDGEIIHSYNSKRNQKLRWKGVFLKAKGGSKVRAVAKGKVVFSDWMDGYGYLIIIQHNNNYLSLYGYNRALYKKDGESVKANEAIAAVGDTGDLSTNGVYFEMRKGKDTINPAKWIKP
jgi:septal ring factor EnvC (AmiA/AmiB activator)